jgi:hypothetical protein
MKRYLIFLLVICCYSVSAQDTLQTGAGQPDTVIAASPKVARPDMIRYRADGKPDTVRPGSLMYRSKQLMANSAYVHDTELDSLIVVFRDHQIYSNSSLRGELWHLTDVPHRVRYSALESKKTFKVEKVNTDTTYFKYTYVKLTDTLMWNGYVGYKHKFTMKDNFTGTTYTVVLYECPDIKIDAEYSKYYFSEVFFLKVPLRLNGAIIKALAEQRIDNKPVMRAELILMRYNDEGGWKGVDFHTPMDRGYTFMLPEGTKKERAYAKELMEELSGRKDYPTIPYKQGFEHE